MKARSRSVFTVLFFVILVSIPLWYYFPRLTAYTAHPLDFLTLLLNASGISDFSIHFVLLNVALFFLAALIDLFSSGWQGSALKRLFLIGNKSARGDLWCWVLSVLSVYDFFVLLFSFGLFYVITSLMLKAGGFHIIDVISGTALQFAVIFCLGDLKQYAWHRFMHLRPFWELHQYHHSATEFNLITSSRGHFLEKGFLTLFDGILFSLVGAPKEYFMAFILLKEFYNYLLHSNLNWNLGWLGKYVLISPRAHTLHHSNNPRFYDKNFGTFFIFWDRLFGTYASTNEAITIGVTNTYYNQHGFWKDMLIGSRNFLKALFAKLSS